MLIRFLTAARVAMVDSRLFQCPVVKFTKIRLYQTCRIEMRLIGETQHAEVLNLVRYPAGYRTRQ